MSVQEQFAEVLSRRTALQVPFALTPPDRAEAPRATPRHRGYRTLKRALDLAIALPLLVLSMPLLLAVALLIRLDSAGPALFRQTRLGLNGVPFGILKFRTMNVLEDGERVVQAARNDARITRIGSVLRRTSLDELPQLWNVVRGEMSLVGPRPHATAHDVFYANAIPDYARRQSVKPGITGWAQVNGYRGGTPTIDLMRRRVEFDIWYAERSGLLLDIFILLRTPVELLRRRNAY